MGKIIISSWAEANKANYLLHRFPVRVEGKKDSRMFCKEAYASRLPTDPARTRMDAIVDFVKREQLTRREPVTQEGFNDLAAQVERDAQTNHVFYAPRHSFDTFLFGNKFLHLFEGIRGLDVGCRTFPGCTPQHEYYRAANARMMGIDILLPAAEQNGVLFMANVLNLDLPPFYENEIFDFITVAMIFGNSSPVNSVFGVAVGISELARTLDNKGLIYIAETEPDMNVVYIAQKLGLRSFINRSDHNMLAELPSGLFFVKADTPLGDNWFSSIIAMLRESRLEIPELTSQVDEEFDQASVYIIR